MVHEGYWVINRIFYEKLDERQAWYTAEETEEKLKQWLKAWQQQTKDGAYVSSRTCQ